MGGLPGAPSLPRMRPEDTDSALIAQVLGTVSKTAQSAVGPLAEAKQRADALKEKVAVGERYLTATEEMDRKLIEIQQDPEARKNAEKVFGDWVKSREPEWAQGLSAEGTAAFKQRLLDKRVTNGHESRMIEVRDLQERTNTTILGYGNRFLEEYARSAPDFIEYAETPDGAVVERETPAFRNLKEALGHAVAAKAKGKQEAAAELLEYRKKAASDKATRLVISRNPADVERLQQLLQHEELNPGTTFLRDLRPEGRTALLKASREQSEHLRKLAVEAEDRAIKAAKERQKEIDEAQTRADNGEIATLTLRIMRGEAGHAELSFAKIYNKTLGGDATRVEHLFELIEKRGSNPGSTNYTVYNQLWQAIRTARGNVDTTALVLPYAGKVGGLTIADAEKLIEIGQKAREDTVFKDDFYQKGQDDIARTLAPPAGIIDEAKQRRFAEASREFYDTASAYVKAGKREQIPTLAREITDRYLKQAKRVIATAPKYVPRYPSREETVRSYERSYGTNAKKWPTAVRAEFNRQIRIHEEMEAEAKARADAEAQGSQSPGPKAAPKPPSKLPNVIK